MSAFFFLLRELLGAIRVRSAILLASALLALVFFLACFAALFLLPEAPALSTGGLGATELVAYVSPRLSPTAINSLFLRLQERPDVQSIRYSLPEQVTSDKTGGSFVIYARSPGSVAELAAALRATDGIASVQAPAGGGGVLALSKTWRLVLLCGLVVCALAALVLAREGFRALLYAFRHEVRLMRLSGVSECTLLAAIEAMGLLIGLLAGILLVVGLALFGMSLSGDGQAGTMAPSRLLAVGGVSVALSLLLGGLLGLLGAAHLASNRFSPMS